MFYLISIGQHGSLQIVFLSRISARLVSCINIISLQILYVYTLLDLLSSRNLEDYGVHVQNTEHKNVNNHYDSNKER